MDIGITLTAFGGMLAGFFAIARMMLNQASGDRQADRKERELLAASITKMAKASERVAMATVQSAKEAKDRNGHLGDQNVQIASLIKDQSADITALKTSNEAIAQTLGDSALINATGKDLLNHDQVVNEQTVIHQTVATKEDKK